MDDLLKKRMDVGIGEFILVIFMFLEIMEFIGILPADFDYMHKMISWVGIAYLLYNVNLTEMIFGYSDKKLDLALIISYFLLVSKDFILYSKNALEMIGESGSSFLVPFYTYILDNAFSIELITFYMGGGLIILLALMNFFINMDVRKPSIMSMVFREGPAENMKEKTMMALASFVVYSAFFAVVFNLIIEWLGWAVDSTLAVLAIFFYLFVFIKHYRRFDTESFLYKVGDAGEGFYEKFISLFRSKDTILLGISGLLVLHLLTDTGNFILPYIIGKKIEYFVALGAGHTTIPALMAIDLGIASSIASKAAVFVVYLLNIAAMLFMFIGPAFLWYEMYTERRIELPNFIYGLFYSSTFIFFVSPVFKIQRLGVEGLYGVDILTKTISVSSSMLVMTTALVILLVMSILSINHVINHLLRYVAVFLVEAFFAYYICLFFADITGFYAQSLFMMKHYFVLFYLFVFLAATVFFYFGGIVYFVYDTIVDITKKFI